MTTRTLGAIALTLGLATSPARAFERSWVVFKDGKEIGTESASGTLEDGRWTVRSEGEVRLVGSVRFEQQTVVEAEGLAFVSYRMQAETNAGTQIIEAERDGEGVRFHVVAGGQDLEQQGTGAAPILCLDNLVIAQYEILGRVALAREGAFDFTIAVPQVMKALPASFERGSSVRVRVGDAVHEAWHGKLKVASLLTEFWYDAENGSALRVHVPAQRLDARVDGWAGVVEEPKAPASGSAAAAASVETELEVESPLGKLPCVLALPPGSGGPFPAVILLAGSGPNDRDETIGPNKPFRDLANGLASRGIASLRCDKRTALLNREITEAIAAEAPDEEIDRLMRKGSGWTLREEYIDDGIAAFEFLGAHQRIDKESVFLLGHSLGALAAAEIERATKGARGVILMAGSGRPIDFLLRDQLTFQAGLAGMSEDETRRHVEARLAPFEELRKGTLGEGETVMGMSAAYWKDLLGRDPVALTAGIRLPVLLLHGGKDIQVREQDFEKLRQALEGREGVTHEAHLFPDLNHLFFPVEGDSTGAEYYETGTVAPQVVQTIADWIRASAVPDGTSHVSR